MTTTSSASTLWQLLQQRAATTPDAPMLIDADEQVWSFADILRHAEHTAAWLHALGVRQDSKVTWQFPTDVGAVLISLALCRLRAIQNPIIHLFGRKEITAILEQFRPAFYFVPGYMPGARDYMALAQASSMSLAEPPRVVAIDMPLRNAEAVRLQTDKAPSTPANVAPEVARWVYYTSGTTAAPKGALHTDASLLASGRLYARALEVNAEDVGAIAFPYAHVGGTMNIVMLLETGMSAVLISKFSAESAVSLYARQQVTQNSGSVAHYTAFLAEQRRSPQQHLFPSLRRLSGGGAPKPPHLYFEAQQELHCKILHCYGMTEAPMITQASPAHTDEQLAYTDGLPVEGIEIRITRADGTPAGAGEQGEIRIKGATVCSGYADSALNASAIDVDGFFATGDIGLLRADGHLILTGRSKDIIIRKGETISAREIEELLGQHPKVAAVAIIGLPDAERGERMCAVIEAAEGLPPLTFGEMQAWFEASGIMRQKIPEQLEIVAHMPRNETFNKILKFKLRERFSDADQARRQS